MSISSINRKIPSNHLLVIEASTVVNLAVKNISEYVHSCLSCLSPAEFYCFWKLQNLSLAITVATFEFNYFHCIAFLPLVSQLLQDFELKLCYFISQPHSIWVKNLFPTGIFVIAVLYSTLIFLTSS